MTRQHIIYISGGGDKYDRVRRFGLRFWRRRGVKATHMPMHWSDPSETFEQKLRRLKEELTRYPGMQTILVGESAGGAVALCALRRFATDIDQVVTVCGMNQGAANVSGRLYDKNPAFRDAMREVDDVVATLSEQERSKILTLYSSFDQTVRPQHTLLKSVTSRDLKMPGHAVTILYVLFLRYRLVTGS